MLCLPYSLAPEFKGKVNVRYFSFTQKKGPARAANLNRDKPENLTFEQKNI